MSHDHCDCMEGLEEHIAWQRDRLAEQDARGLRLAGELDQANKTLWLYRDEYDRLRRVEEAARQMVVWLDERTEISPVRGLGALRNALAEEKE